MIIKEYKGEYASQVYGTVGLKHFGDVPRLINRLCSFKDAEDESAYIKVMTSDDWNPYAPYFFCFTMGCTAIMKEWSRRRRRKHQTHVF